MGRNPLNSVSFSSSSVLSCEQKQLEEAHGPAPHSPFHSFPVIRATHNLFWDTVLVLHSWPGWGLSLLAGRAVMAVTPLALYDERGGENGLITTVPCRA